MSDYGKNAVASRTRCRQVQLGVPGVQEEVAGQARILLCRLQMRTGLCTESHRQ